MHPSVAVCWITVAVVMAVIIVRLFFQINIVPNYLL
jgi:hypothetical protein